MSLKEDSIIRKGLTGAVLGVIIGFIVGYVTLHSGSCYCPIIIYRSTIIAGILGYAIGNYTVL